MCFFLTGGYAKKMNICNIGIVLWETFAFQNKVVSLQNFPTWLCLLVQVWLLLSNPQSHFCLDAKQILSQRTFFPLDSGQAPQVEDEYRHTWGKKRGKKALHGVPGHVWLGQLIPCSRISSLKFNPWLFLYDNAVLKGVLRGRVFEISK